MRTPSFDFSGSFNEACADNWLATAIAAKKTDNLKRFCLGVENIFARLNITGQNGCQEIGGTVDGSFWWGETTGSRGRPPHLIYPPAVKLRCREGAGSMGCNRCCHPPREPARYIQHTLFNLALMPFSSGLEFRPRLFKMPSCFW